jgi:hypothetical protein
MSARVRRSWTSHIVIRTALVVQGEDRSMRSYLFRCSRARAQSLVEYSLISALVAIVVLATLFLLGPQITSIFQTITNNL